MTPRSAAPAATATKKKAVVKAAPKTATPKTAARAMKAAPKAAGRAMKAASKPPVKRAGDGTADAPAHPHPPVAYRLHALLHTMHSIEHHEDHLCTLLTAIEREGAVAPALGQELAALLEELPMQAFVAELEAARQALAATGEAKQKRA